MSVYRAGLSPGTVCVCAEMMGRLVGVDVAKEGSVRSNTISSQSRTLSITQNIQCRSQSFFLCDEPTALYMKAAVHVNSKKKSLL